MTLGLSLCFEVGSDEGEVEGFSEGLLLGVMLGVILKRSDGPTFGLALGLEL